MSVIITSTPLAEIEITHGLIRRLISDQMPELSEMPIHIMEAGWDNLMVRIGKDQALRLPRRAAAVDLVLKEKIWLPKLAPLLPLPIPVPTKFGTPTEYYPYPRSLQTWLPGIAADLAAPDADQATVLARFLKRLHTLSFEENLPGNPTRDCGLREKKIDTEIRMKDLQNTTQLITPCIKDLWAQGLIADIDAPPCFISGDIHARNVLVQNGKISAIIDWGDMCAGDPATDLAGIWGLFDDPNARQTAVQTYAPSPAMLIRAKAWAVFYGVILLHTGQKDTPRHAKMGADILRRLDSSI